MWESQKFRIIEEKTRLWESRSYFEIIFNRFYFQRAGQLDEDEIRRMETIMLNPRQYKIPDWFLNRQKDCKDGTYSQTISNGLDTKLREDLERMKKVNNFKT